MYLKRFFRLGTALIIFAALRASTAFAGEQGEAKAAVQHYLIISPHTAAECLSALDDIAAKGKDELARWDWGCAEGEHTGYLIADAAGKEAALAMVPQTARSKAKAIVLNKFSIEQIRAFHESHKGD